MNKTTFKLQGEMVAFLPRPNLYGIAIQPRAISICVNLPQALYRVGAICSISL
jgi:hypothetical protein